MWTVQEGKTKLSDLLERARGGEQQVIGARDSCVVVSLDDYKRLMQRDEKAAHGQVAGPEVRRVVAQGYSGLSARSTMHAGEEWFGFALQPIDALIAASAIAASAQLAARNTKVLDRLRIELVNSWTH